MAKCGHIQPQMPQALHFSGSEKTGKIYPCTLNLSPGMLMHPRVQKCSQYLHPRQCSSFITISPLKLAKGSPFYDYVALNYKLKENAEAKFYVPTKPVGAALCGRLMYCNII